jgi:hypothetical protein
MQTSHKIVPAHEADGFIVEWAFQGKWNEIGCLRATKEQAEASMKATAKFEGWAPTKVRVSPKKEWVAAFPSQDYIEKMWLAGYQGARNGEGNPYGDMHPDDTLDNQLLWNEGAAAFRSGLQLFGN